FFTSRMFDEFDLLSNSYQLLRRRGENFLMERHLPTPGTGVFMYVSTRTARTTSAIFDKYADEDGDYSFTKTHVPIALAKQGQDNLVSRSQAKRLLARFDKFTEVCLDFAGVDSIGQAFADEIFRVFAA